MVDGKEEVFGFQMENSASNNQVLVCKCAARVELGVRADDTYTFVVVVAIVGSNQFATK